MEFEHSIKEKKCIEKLLFGKKIGIKFPRNHTLLVSKMNGLIKI